MLSGGDTPESQRSFATDPHGGSSAGSIVAAALALVAAVFLFEPLDRLTARIALDYNEGWNAYRAAAAAHGALYPPAGSWLTVNYPPLSFELLGAVSRWWDPIVAGRCIALASLAAVAVLTLFASRRLGASATAAATGALWLVAVHAAYFHGYVGMNDPQWLGHALATAGLLVLLGGDPSRGSTGSAPAGTSRSARTLALAAALLVAAGLVKHSLIPLPAAITLWLAGERGARPRAAVRWVVIAGLFLAGALAACRIRYGAAFLDNVLVMESHRPWSFAELVAKARESLPPLLAGIAAAVYIAVREVRPARLVALYAGLSLAWGAFTAGGLGVDVNAWFDLSIAAALALGVAYDGVASRWRRAVPLIVLCAPVLALPERVESLRTWRATRDAVAREARADVARIAAAPGPALCESPALCYWAGKPEHLDLFSAEMRLRRLPADRGELLARFTRREFGVIQIARPRLLSNLFPGAEDHWRDGYVASHSCPVAGAILVRTSR